MRRIGVPLSEWPEADRHLWRALFKKGHPLDDTGRLAHFRATTEEKLRNSYSYWLAWVSYTTPAQLLAPPLERVTAAGLDAWRRSMDHLAPNTLATRLQAMGQILRGMDPARPTKSEKSVIRYAKEHADFVGSQRKQGRVVDSAILQSAGIRHFRAHLGHAGSDIDAAVHCRDGVMIALLAAMPMRRRPFVNLEMGRSLRHGPEGWRVYLDEDDLKAGTSWEASVPSSLQSLLEQYVETVRPLLASRSRHPSRLLWLTNEGRPIEAAYFGVRIKELTRRLIGRDISCHLFRDCAATTLALSSSDSARSIKALLGHASERTSTRHYIQATSIEAGRLLTASVTAIKGDN